IGRRPTFGGEETTVEVHIINYEGNLYGLHVVVSVIERLRGERKFDSTGALAVQLREDVQTALQMFDNEINHEIEDER
ncbi:MAG: riboflavin kinase, partial [Bacteroidaceae bacterium]|nr:riboflavin kinase [Bacteroidaceae bacterium]